jgi:formamidopyrimidine-DNA glycosylase
LPELPEVETIRIGLERSISGARVEQAAIFAFPGVIEPMSIEQFRAAVQGVRIGQINRRGKYLLIDLSNDQTLMVHLRMTGQLLVEPAGTPATRFEHLRLTLDDGRELRFADQRKFGRVTIWTEEEVRYLDRKLGVEPLDRRFTAQWLERGIERRTAMIKAILLDQTFVAGIGNIYADESLFHARIHPQRIANTLTREETHRLHRQIRRILRIAIDRRGTTFSHYRDSGGETGENQRYLEVYGRGRSGARCRRCTTELICLTVSGRSSHLCPQCQQIAK